MKSLPTRTLTGLGATARTTDEISSRVPRRGAYRQSAPASAYARNRRIVSSRSGRPTTNPSDRPVSSTRPPWSSIAFLAARILATDRSKGNRGSAASSLESSIDRPAMPVSTARATFAATPSGSTAYPPSKSALTGTSTDPATARRCSSTSSRVTRLSDLPWVHAKPALVVASALKPSPASRRALPASHGFGMTKQPERWRARNVSVRSAGLCIAGA